jgi:hypothetical protein
VSSHEKVESGVGLLHADKTASQQLEGEQKGN